MSTNRTCRVCNGAFNCFSTHGRDYICEMEGYDGWVAKEVFCSDSCLKQNKGTSIELTDLEALNWFAETFLTDQPGAKKILALAKLGAAVSRMPELCGQNSLDDTIQLRFFAVWGGLPHWDVRVVNDDKMRETKRCETPMEALESAIGEVLK